MEYCGKKTTRKLKNGKKKVKECKSKKFDYSYESGSVTRVCQRCGSKNPVPLKTVVNWGVDEALRVCRKLRYDVESFMHIEPGTPYWEHTIGKNPRLQKIADEVKAVMFLDGSAIGSECGGGYGVGFMVQPSGDVVECIKEWYNK